MVINFQKCAIKTDIAGQKVEIIDIREAFANIVYQRITGIAGLTLAQKIYTSNGKLEISAEEASTIKSCAETYCLPPVVEAINSQLTQCE